MVVRSVALLHIVLFVGNAGRARFFKKTRSEPTANAYEPDANVMKVSQGASSPFLMARPSGPS